jgi:hypothetical protein
MVIWGVSKKTEGSFYASKFLLGKPANFCLSGIAGEPGAEVMSRTREINARFKFVEFLSPGSDVIGSGFLTYCNDDGLWQRFACDLNGVRNYFPSEVLSVGALTALQESDFLKREYEAFWQRVNSFSIV